MYSIAFQLSCCVFYRLNIFFNVISNSGLAILCLLQNFAGVNFVGCTSSVLLWFVFGFACACLVNISGLRLVCCVFYCLFQFFLVSMLLLVSGS